MSWRHIPGTSSIERKSGSTLDEVDFDESGLTVRLEAGSGYLREKLDTFVPMSVVVEMLRQAGYCLAELPTDRQVKP